MNTNKNMFIKRKITITASILVLLIVGIGSCILQSKLGVKEAEIVQAQAPQTIWCNPANTGAEDGLTKATGYNTLHEAIAAMSSGSTVIIADGDWTSYANMYIDGANAPPSGSDGNYTNIQAETDWEVRLPYIFSYKARSYVEIRGIVFDSRANPMPHIVYEWHHTKFIRCGFLAGKLQGNAHTCGFGSADSTRQSNPTTLWRNVLPGVVEGMSSTASTDSIISSVDVLPGMIIMTMLVHI